MVELVLGWLAVLVAASIVAFSYFGGFIAQESVQRDLLGFGAVLGSMALGVTLDSLLDWLPGRVLLGLATLVFLAITAISFISFLFVPAALAVAATVPAFVHPALRHTPQTH
ncbi:MAG TPA: hypothetical protein VKQ36_11345 [Ktedonobacterales bacterium]|nr:hypothetical protein [Ktedonobacterales bacterium]